jgi:hypothetical protein
MTYDVIEHNGFWVRVGGAMIGSFSTRRRDVVVAGLLRGPGRSSAAWREA